MRFSSFTYLVGQGLHNLRANRLMTFASMGVLTVCMLLIGAAYLLGVNIDYMVEYIGNQNETVVYMDDATEDQIAAADIDGDGSVDSTDVYYILYYVALQGAGKNPTWDFVLGRK